MELDLLPEDAQAAVLAAIPMNELVEKREVSTTFRQATEAHVVRDTLAKMYDIPMQDTFNQLLEEHDKKYWSPRCEKYNSFEVCIRLAIEARNWHAVLQAEEGGWNNWIGGLITAAQAGDEDFTSYFTDKVMDEPRYSDREKRIALVEALNNAVRSGHISIVELLGSVIPGGYSIGRLLPVAAQANQLGVVEYLMEQEPPSIRTLNNVLWMAATKDSRKVIDYLINKDANDWDSAMAAAANAGNADLVQFFINKGARDWDRGLLTAANGGHVGLVRFFVEQGVTDIRQPLLAAEDRLLRSTDEEQLEDARRYQEVVDYLRSL